MLSYFKECDFEELIEWVEQVGSLFYNIPIFERHKVSATKSLLN